MQAVEIYGFDWISVEEFVATRTLKQITNYAIKHFGHDAVKPYLLHNKIMDKKSTIANNQ